MTPTQPNYDTIRAKLRLIQEALDDLETLGAVTAERLREDRLTCAAIERLLSRIVDLAVDVNTHVSVARLARAPADYQESFTLAADAGLLPTELAASLAPSVGLRNAIVHTYLNLDLAKVAEAVPLALDGYRRYIREVARSLKKQRDEGTDDAPRPR